MYEMNGDYPIIEYFEEHYRDLLQLALRMMKDLDDAYDVLQDVAVVMMQKREELYDVEDPAAFLAVCIRRRALNFLRDSKRSTAMAPDVLENFRTCESSQMEMELSEWTMWLEKYLKKCAPEMRRAFIEHYLDDIPLEMIAERMGIKPNTLSQQFRRMRQSIARQSPRTMVHLMVLMLEV